MSGERHLDRRLSGPVASRLRAIGKLGHEIAAGIAAELATLLHT